MAMNHTKVHDRNKTEQEHSDKLAAALGTWLHNMEQIIRRFMMKTCRELSIHTDSRPYANGLVVKVLRRKPRSYCPTQSSLARIMRMIHDNPEDVLVDANLNGHLAVYLYQ